MENEIMNNVELDEVIEVFQDDGHNNGVGVVGVLIGAAVMGVGSAAFKWGKKKYAERKAKKTEGVLKFKDDENKTEDEEVTEE